MKKFLLFLLCSFCLWGCQKIPVYTFSVGNEQISILLDEKWSLKEKEGGFSIEDSAISIQGMFMQTNMFDAYYQAVMDDESAHVIMDSNQKLIWNVNGDSGMECNCIYRITDSTSVLMGSLDDVVDVYKHISFEAK